MRMLTKLAAHAESGSPDARPLADAALREQVTRLQANWSLEDPNPESYSRVLQHLAVRTGIEDADPVESASFDLDPLRVLQMSLESGTMGPLVLRAVDRAVGLGQVPSVLDLLSARPERAEPVHEAVLARLVEPATLKVLLDQEPIDIDSLDSLLPHMTKEGYELLLDALASADNRATRRKLIDRLTRTAPDLGLAIAARLRDDRWYVQRNMLVLLDRSGRVPPGFSPAPWTVHEDPRLRSEAMAIATALADPDPRVLGLGLAAIQEDVPPAHADRVLAIAEDAQADDEVRLLAIAALANLKDARAMRVLTGLVDGGRTLLGRQRLASKTPAMLAALRALAARETGPGKAAALLALAGESSDADVREAARRQGA
jgi:hypothetical protein